LLAILSRVHVITITAELSTEDAPQIGLVIDDEDLLTL
jgi:hypothetical protein